MRDQWNIVTKGHSPPTTFTLSLACKLLQRSYALSLLFLCQFHSAWSMFEGSVPFNMRMQPSHRWNCICYIEGATNFCIYRQIDMLNYKITNAIYYFSFSSNKTRTKRFMLYLFLMK